MFAGSCLYCSSSHPPRIIEDNPKLCGMDDLKLQTSQAGFWTHSLRSTWASLANISLGQSQRRCPHGTIMLSGRRHKIETRQFQLGLLGSLATPNDEEQCRFVDLRDTMVWNIWIGRLATEWWNFDQEFLLIPRGNGICKSNNPDFRKSIFASWPLFVSMQSMSQTWIHQAATMTT